MIEQPRTVTFEDLTLYVIIVVVVVVVDVKVNCEKKQRIFNQQKIQKSRQGST